MPDPEPTPRARPDAVVHLVASDSEGRIAESKLTCFARDQPVPCSRIPVRPGESLPVRVHAEGYRDWKGTVTSDDAGSYPVKLNLSL